MMLRYIINKITFAKILSFVVFLMAFFCFCNAQNQKIMPPNDKIYSIDLDKRKEPDFYLSTIFDKVKTIILETNKNCLIGRVQKLLVFDGRIYVFDEYIAKSLFVFDEEGRFIRKIGNIGRGPGENNHIHDFTLDTDHRFIYLLDDGGRIHQYGFDGDYIRTVRVQIPRANIRYIHYAKDRIYADVQAWTSTATDFLLFEINPADGKILSRSVSVSDNKGWNETYYTGSSFFTPQLNDASKYAHLFMNYIVSLGDIIHSHVELKSKNLTTQKDIANALKAGGMSYEKYAIIARSSKIRNVHNYVENAHFIFFHYWHTKTTNIVFLDKKTNAVTLANMVNNDLIYKNNEDGVLYPIKFSDAKGMYEIPDDSWLPRFKELAKNGKIVQGLDKMDQLIKLDEEPNPIIFFYEYKDAE